MRDLNLCRSRSHQPTARTVHTTAPLPPAHRKVKDWQGVSFVAICNMKFSKVCSAVIFCKKDTRTMTVGNFNLLLLQLLVLFPGVWLSVRERCGVTTPLPLVLEAHDTPEVAQRSVKSGLLHIKRDLLYIKRDHA